MIVGILRFRVCTLFLNKNFKEKEPKGYVFFSSSTTRAIYPEGLSVFVGSDKVGTESLGLSSNDCNLQGLSRGLKFLF